MMKKSFLNMTLMAAFAGLFSLGTVSCSDDDNSGDNGGENDTTVMDESQTEEAISAARMLSMVADTVATDLKSLKSMRVQPTIGMASSNNSGWRIVYVSDLKEAQMNFASIAGCKVSELNGSKNFDFGEYGSLEWNVSPANAENIATVEVNSQLISGLQRIVYCREDQGGDNATNIVGTCHYRLGDVIEDAQGYYWVCVSPSFEGKKANESYWVNVFNAAASGEGVNTHKTPGIATENIYSKYDKKYNSNTIQLPTGLLLNRQQNYNFANLIWALLKPDTYKTIVGTTGTGLCGFNYEYHGAKYLTRVNEYWQENKIWEKLFNRTYDQMSQFQNLNFFYNGYHWKVGSTAGVWIYKSSGYQHDYSGSDDNDDTLFEMKKAGFGFDIRRYASDSNEDKACASTGQDAMAPAKQFSATDGYWVIRVKKGSKIDKKYDAQKNMTGVYDVYRYNDKTNKTAGKESIVETEDDIEINNQEPIVVDEEDYNPLDEPVVGAVLGSDGFFYKTRRAANNRTFNNAIGIVVYMGGEKRVEKGKNWNGLVMALDDVYHILANTDTYTFNSDNTRYLYCSTASTKGTSLARILDGNAMTTQLKDGCNANHEHPMAEHTYNWGHKVNYKMHDDPDRRDFSDWFVPSIGQWILALQGMGASWNGSEFSNVNLETPFDSAGVLSYLPKFTYTTITEKDFANYYTVKIEDKGKSAKVQTVAKNIPTTVRAFIAFKYNGGGTKDPETIETEVMEQPALPGYVLAKNGKFYKTVADAQSAGSKAAAMVLCSDIDETKKVETNESYTGLAMSVSNRGTSAWYLGSSDQLYASNTANPADLAGLKDGLKQSKALYDKGDQFIAYDAYEDSGINANGFSKWFLPSAGQWIMGTTGLGATWSNTTSNNAMTVVNNALEKAGLGDSKLDANGEFWAVTQYDETRAWVFGKNGFNYVRTTTLHPCRQFIAFKVDR